MWVHESENTSLKAEDNSRKLSVTRNIRDLWPISPKLPRIVQNAPASFIKASRMSTIAINIAKFLGVGIFAEPLNGNGTDLLELTKWK